MALDAALAAARLLANAAGAAALHDSGKLGYRYNSDPTAAEPDSDVYALLTDGVISVTPMSLDMTSRTDMFRLSQILLGKQEYGR